MPIVKIAKAIKDLQPNETMEVHATDPAFKADVEAWTRKTGNELVNFSDGPVKTALLRKA